MVRCDCLFVLAPIEFAKADRLHFVGPRFSWTLLSPSF